MAEEVDTPVDTGLAGMTLEPPVEVLAPVAAPVTVAVNAQLPDSLSPFDLAKLAREIAMDIKEISVVLAHYKLTLAQYEIIKENPYFKRALDTAIIDWNSALSTHARISIESAAILEDALPKLGARMTKADESLAMQVEAGKLMAKLAGIGESSKGAGSSEKFTITINLGSDTIRYEKNVAPSEASGGAGPLREIIEGQANPPSV